METHRHPSPSLLLALPLGPVSDFTVSDPSTHCPHGKFALGARMKIFRRAGNSSIPPLIARDRTGPDTDRFRAIRQQVCRPTLRFPDALQLNASNKKMIPGRYYYYASFFFFFLSSRPVFFTHHIRSVLLLVVFYLLPAAVYVTADRKSNA